MDNKNLNLTVTYSIPLSAVIEELNSDENLMDLVHFPEEKIAKLCAKGKIEDVNPESLTFNF